MKRLVPVSLIALFLSSATSAVPAQTRRTPNAPAPAEQPSIPQTPVPPDWDPPTFCGRVIALSDKGLTIKPEGWVMLGIISYNADWTLKTNMIYKQDNTKPPRSFVFHGHVLQTLGRSGHKVTDVQVGDVVRIECRRLHGIANCVDIVIERRPGGGIPPALDTDTPEKWRKHTLMNTQQFVEETVVPKWIPRMLMRLHP